jgi:DNA-binding GntR family transcriptional regulator
LSTGNRIPSSARAAAAAPTDGGTGEFDFGGLLALHERGLAPGISATSGRHATKLGRSLHSGWVAALLREAIVGGSLSAGTPLVEMRLAEQLGVSRGPVRSALHVLEGEGLVTTTRYHLEARAIQLGMERQSDLDDVEQAFSALLREGNSTPRLVSLDVAFHRALVEFSRSRFLLRAWLALAPVIQTAIAIGNRHLVEQDPQSNFSRIVDSHQALMDALRARDADAAETMLARQFDFSRSMVTAGT